MRRVGQWLRGERGQMSVELAVCLPVILMVMVLAIDMLVFMAECARFDHVVPQQIEAYATSVKGSNATISEIKANILESLESKFDADYESVSVSQKKGSTLLNDDSRVRIYTCTLEMTPWPLASGGITLFGMTIPTSLTHTCSLAIDPYDVGFW